MICPYCGCDDGRVIDSRASEGGSAISRRRQCNDCDRRFTTYERIEEGAKLMVVKHDGRREAFDIAKIRRALDLACGKRPVADSAKQGLVEVVEDAIHRKFDREVDSTHIGRLVAERLRDLDEIAYIRFASEYEEFKSVGDILETVRELSERVRDAKDQQRLFDEEEARSSKPGASSGS